jgi:urease accessory protein
MIATMGTSMGIDTMEAKVPPSHPRFVSPGPAAVAKAEEKPPGLQALLRLQSWLSPTFPIGAYCYSHALEWTVQAGTVHDRASLVDWLEADLRFGSGRNDGLFFCAAWTAARAADVAAVVEVAELAAAFRGTSEFALEASQQGAACLAALKKAWPHAILAEVSAAFAERRVAATLAVCLGVACAVHGVPKTVGLPLYLQSLVANLVTAAVRLIPLGQSEGQLAIASLEDAVSGAALDALAGSLNDLGSAAFMVDLASAAHETQYTRLFRS